MYRKHGYHDVGTWAKYYDGGEDVLVLEKHIRSFFFCVLKQLRLLLILDFHPNLVYHKHYRG